MQDITLLFRIVFGNQKRAAALAGLLNAILGREGDSRIRQLEIQNPLREKDRLEQKSSILDVKARDGQGHFYSIEVQLATQAL